MFFIRLWLILQIKFILRDHKEKNALKTINRKLKRNGEIKHRLPWSKFKIEKRSIHVSTIKPRNLPIPKTKNPRCDWLPPIVFEDSNGMFMIDGKHRLSKWWRDQSTDLNNIFKNFIIIKI